MKLTIELEEPYAKELELRAYRSGQTVKEYVEESMRTVVVADMSFPRKDCPTQGTRREKLTGIIGIARTRINESLTMRAGSSL